MRVQTRPGGSVRHLMLIVTFGLLAAVACQPAPSTPVAPTAAPPKPTAAPAAAPAASPATSPVASPSPSPAASPVAKPAAPSPSPVASPVASGRVLTFDAADFSFTTPDTIQAGQITLVMRNTGQEPHHAQLMRLNTGITLDQFMAALRQGEGPALALVSQAGGPGPVGANATSEVTVDLREGQYVVICFIPSPDGIPHLAKGMVKPLQVTAPPAPAAPAPTARETLTMKDFTYEMPDSLPAGRNTYRVVSAGPAQPHEIQFTRLQPGRTAQDISAFWSAPPAGPPPYVMVGGMQGLDPNGVGWVTVDLQPGEYAAICVIPDPSSGRRHIELGMIKPFTVR